MGATQPVRFENMPTRSFVGLRATYGMNAPVAIPAQWQRFAPYIGSIPGEAGRVAYGIVGEMRMQPFSFDYMAAVEVVSGSAPPPALQIWTLPACHYAVFAHEGPVTRLKETIDAIWTSWLPDSGRETLDEPHMLERYGPGFDPRKGEGDIELWLAIKA